MDKSISEFRHLLQAMSKTLFKNAILFQNGKGVGITFRRSQTFRPDNMIRDIQAGLYADLKVVFGAPDEYFIFKKFSLRRFGNLAGNVYVFIQLSKFLVT